MIALLAAVLPDELLERVRSNIVGAIAELQRIRIVRAAVLEDVELADGVEMQVSHTLGRRALVFVSAVRGATTTGRIDEIRDEVDRTKFVKLKASGFGATITVDLLVVP